MHISLSEAKARLTDLVRRAEAGDEIILTRHGRAAVRLVPVKPAITAKAKAAVLEAVWTSACAKRAERGSELIDAARSQDFLHDETGLPG